mmetsp:Transcript_16795/g.29623  ORF Transcript_16795/g.29623 Transcript_16795/m.29623 type:complete len:258 (+) Transcript_16795:749-1522(+)
MTREEKEVQASDRQIQASTDVPAAPPRRPTRAVRPPRPPHTYWPIGRCCRLTTVSWARRHYRQNRQSWNDVVGPSFWEQAFSFGLLHWNCRHCCLLVWTVLWVWIAIASLVEWLILYFPFASPVPSSSCHRRRHCRYRRHPSFSRHCPNHPTAHRPPSLSSFLCSERMDCYNAVSSYLANPLRWCHLHRYFPRFVACMIHETAFVGHTLPLLSLLLMLSLFLFSCQLHLPCLKHSSPRHPPPTQFRYLPTHRHPRQF